MFNLRCGAVQRELSCVWMRCGAACRQGLRMQRSMRMHFFVIRAVSNVNHAAMEPRKILPTPSFAAQCGLQTQLGSKVCSLKIVTTNELA